MVKLGSAVDFLKKGIYSPQTFQDQVQRAGLQGKLDAVKNLGQTLFGSRGGGEVYSGSMQQSTVLQGLPKGTKLPTSTEVLGDAGLSLDSFRINQPPLQGAPLSAPSRNLEFNMALNKSPAGGFAGDSNAGVGGRVLGVDSATRAMGYKYQPPSQTGLPWPVAADPKTGEMLTLKGKPLPPLVGPSFPTSDVPAPVRGGVGSGESGVGSGQPKAQSPFKQGFETSTGTAASPQKQMFFKRTPEQTQGMGIVDRLKFAAGRAAGDIASDASRGQYWRYNHPLAIAGSAFERLAGGNKVGGALAGFAGIQALGQTSNQFDLMNPGQAFRPKGFSAAYPVSDSDKTQIASGPLGYAKELIGRYVFGRNGNLLPYEQFSKERPDVKQEDYQRYSQYLKGGGANGPMPAGTIDVGGFGVLKGNINGINGPEARLAGFSVTPLGAAAGTATATGVASIFNKGLRGTALKGLGAVGAGLDYSNRLREGQSPLQAAKGTGVSTTAALVGGQYGATLGARFGPVGAVAGGLVGGAVGAIGGDTAIQAVDAQAQKIRDVQASGKADPVSNFLAQTPIGQLAMKSLPGGQNSQAPAQADGDRAMSTATDQLLKASAKYKLVKQADGSFKSVVNDTGTAVRGEVQKIDDGDTYKVRTYNPQTQQFESNNVRLQGADTRETADHASTGAFQNHMIDKQKRDQGFADNNAVFAQGEKDKQAAEKLVPVGSVPYFQGTNTAAHDRPARDVATESGARDVGETLVKQGNAVVYPTPGSSADKKAGGGGRGGNPDALKLAQLRDGKGGQGDRNNQSKLQNTDLQNQGRLQNTDLSGRYKLANTGLQNQGRLQNTDLQGRYKIANTQEVNKGRLQNTDLSGRYKLANTGLQNQGKLQVADLTSGRKLQGQVYTADSKLQGTAYTADQKLRGTAYTADRKVNQEGVKQSGQANVADIKAGATLGAAKSAADAKVAVAGIGLQGTQYKADATVKVADVNRQAKTDVEDTKALSAINTGVMKAGAALMQSDEKTRVARLKQLGVY